MPDRGEDSRLVAACDQCGSIYAAMELSDGSIQPIGSRTGCTSCGGREFTPVTFEDGSESVSDDD